VKFKKLGFSAPLMRIATHFDVTITENC